VVFQFFLRFHFVNSFFLCSLLYLFYFPQAFQHTAKNIYDKIRDGIFDVTNESSGIKVGPQAGQTSTTVRPGEAPAKQGGCC